MKTLFKVIYDNEVWEVLQSKRDSTGETVYKLARRSVGTYCVRTARACDCAPLEEEDGGSDAA